MSAPASIRRVPESAPALSDADRLRAAMDAQSYRVTQVRAICQLVSVATDDNSSTAHDLDAMTVSHAMGIVVELLDEIAHQLDPCGVLSAEAQS